MPAALVGLGSNVGDRQQTLRLAIELLRGTPGVSAVRASAWHATTAVGGPQGQGEFLNGAAVVETSLSPESLLAQMKEIEQALGRVRREKWEPRTIDLDLLLYDAVVQHSPALQLPHPRMAFRRFVLQPAVEVAAEMRHPTIGWTVAQLLEHLQTAMPYVAISGALYSATHTFAQAVAAKTGWKLIEFATADDDFSPLGSPSLGVRQTIEFLRKQAKLLARKNWPRTAGSGAISPFWIEDLLAVGDVLWPGAVDEAWQAMESSVVRPKLLVVCEATSQQFQQPSRKDSIQTHDSIYAEGKKSGSIAVALWHQLNEARRQRTARPGIGPVLWLEGVEQDAAVNELAAAIQAMS
jgi:2-amino-4-hydroxy-6-hydroxymethyldihydropteridine diphosphokinase